MKGFLIRWVLRVLLSSAPLPSSPRLAPRITVEPSTDILCVTESRGLEAAPRGALNDPTFVALLRGVRVGARLFWEGYVWGSFIDASSGKSCSREEISKGGPLRFVIALMRAGSPVLRCKTALCYYLRVWSRRGMQLEVRNGHVRSTGRPLPLDNERWEDSFPVDALIEDFTAAANE